MESPKQYFFVVVQGDDVGKRYPLKNGINTLGRSAENTIVIDTLQISRRHLRISPAVGSFAIEDVGSTNGTWVNGKRLTRPYILVVGDEVQFAGNFTLRFEQQAVQLSPDLLPPAPQPPTTTPETPLAFSDADTDTDAGTAQKSTPAWMKSTVQEKPTRRRRLMFIIILLVLTVIALIVAVYIWGSPPEFWEQVLGWFNIPVP